MFTLSGLFSCTKVLIFWLDSIKGDSDNEYFFEYELSSDDKHSVKVLPFRSIITSIDSENPLR